MSAATASQVFVPLNEGDRFEPGETPFELLNLAHAHPELDDRRGGAHGEDFPEVSVIPHGVSMVVDALLIDQDEAQWNAETHPHFIGRVEALRKPGDDRRSVTTDYPSLLIMRNATQWQSVGMGIYGPTGPNLGSGGVSDGPAVETPPSSETQ